LLDTIAELLYFSAAFGIVICQGSVSNSSTSRFQTRHLLADRFQLSAVTAKDSKNSSAERTGFREITRNWREQLAPSGARLKCVSSFPEMGQRGRKFSHNGTVSPLFSRFYQQFVLTLKSEMLYVWPRSYGLALCPQ
jgi:hypothetical protein